MGEADECPSSSFFLPFLLLPTPLLPNLQISPLNEKVKEETNFHFERDVLERNTKSGKGRTKLPKGVNGEQNTHREKERQIDKSKKNKSVVTGAAKGGTLKKDVVFPKVNFNSQPPSRRALLPRKKTLLFQCIGEGKQQGYFPSHHRGYVETTHKYRK